MNKYLYSLLLKFVSLEDSKNFRLICKKTEAIYWENLTNYTHLHPTINEIKEVKGLLYENCNQVEMVRYMRDGLKKYGFKMPFDDDDKEIFSDILDEITSQKKCNIEILEGILELIPIQQDIAFPFLYRLTDNMNEKLKVIVRNRPDVLLSKRIIRYAVEHGNIEVFDFLIGEYEKHIGLFKFEMVDNEKEELNWDELAILSGSLDLFEHMIKLPTRYEFQITHSLTIAIIEYMYDQIKLILNSDHDASYDLFDYSLKDWYIEGYNSRDHALKKCGCYIFDGEYPELL